jgi:hypothetical protein
LEIAVVDFVDCRLQAVVYVIMPERMEKEGGSESMAKVESV